MSATTPTSNRPTLVPPLARRPLALVHDYLLVLRGAERTFAAMADCWPEAPVHTFLYDARATKERFGSHPVRTSPLQRLPVRQGGFRKLLPLFPLAAQQMETDGYDVVVSSSSAFAHGVPTHRDAHHICYCHTPFRYAWFEQQRAEAEVGAFLRPMLRAILAGVRGWDLRASRRVTRYVANSEFTRERIAKVWGRDSTVIHPPVETSRFSVGEPEDYFLVVSELVPHKRTELALEAGRRSQARVRVVGTGPDESRLRAKYAGSVEFCGRVSAAELEKQYAGARALLIPNVEEFGIAGVEAQAAGRPVIAADAGGARETILDGVTGTLVPEDDIDAMSEAMRYTDFDRFPSERTTEHAERFSTTVFQRRFQAEVARVTTAA